VWWYSVCRTRRCSDVEVWLRCSLLDIACDDTQSVVQEGALMWECDCVVVCWTLRVMILSLSYKKVLWGRWEPWHRSRYSSLWVPACTDVRCQTVMMGLQWCGPLFMSLCTRRVQSESQSPGVQKEDSGMYYFLDCTLSLVLRGFGRCKFLPV